MEIFAGKAPAERNKIIAAIVLGVLALFALYMAFGPSFRSKANPNVTPSTSPSIAGANTNQRTRDFDMPSPGDANLPYMVPVVYNGVIAQAPETGRNIFAFYEPPPPTPWVEPPTAPAKTPPPPPPPIQIAYVMPQSVYAGIGGFRLEVNGDKFTREMQVYFNQSQMPTSFVTAQRITAEIPAAMIADEGPKAILVQSLDGKLYSNQIILNVQAPPKPQFQYIGMIARKRYNNDTAYFQEAGKQLPTAARLNDVVGGRFLLMSISSAETVLEDINLGFRYKLPLVQTAGGGSTGTSSGRPDFPGDVYVPYNPQQNIPGIPNNIPRYVPPQQPPKQQPRPQPDKKDVDDNDDDDTDN